MSAIKEKLGYRHEVVDRQLAHAPRNKVDAAYDRAAFLDEPANNREFDGGQGRNRTTDTWIFRHSSNLG
jgi:hypothetical protein